MTEAAVSFTGNLTDQPEVRYTDSGIARARFRVAVSGRRDGDDQDHAEPGPLASSTSDATVRDAGEGAAACWRPAPSCPGC